MIEPISLGLERGGPSNLLFVVGDDCGGPAPGALLIFDPARHGEAVAWLGEAS